MQLGKMYLVKEFFWLLFPTKELATGCPSRRCCGVRRAVQSAKWTSEYLSCNVFVVELNTCVVLLEQDKDHFKVLDSNGNIGWIRCWSFASYFKLVKE